jgi:hypothetical protein
MKVSMTSLCSSAVMATCGFTATASRSARVRCAVSSMTRRSGSGLMRRPPLRPRLGGLAADGDDGALDGWAVMAALDHLAGFRVASPSPLGSGRFILGRT